MASEDVSSVKVEPPSDPSHDQQDVESGRVTSNEPLVAYKHQTLPAIRMEQLEDTIKDVLKTRPSVRMASRHRVLLSPIHSPLHDSFNRTDTTRHTLPHSTMRSAKSDSEPDQSALTVRRRQLRKASFLSSFSLGNGLPLQRRNSPNLNVEDGSPNIDTALRDNPLVTSSNTASGLSIVVQDVERDETTQSIGEEEINVLGTLERSNELRKSTLHLKHRMLKHRQTMELLEDKAVEAGCIANWKYVKWPKVKSWLQVQLSRRLWKNHLKEVEGHFGTAVVSYFIFLRWLFIMNLLIFMLWFGIICIPEIVYVASRSFNTTSETSCVYELPNTKNYTCVSNQTTTVYSLPSNCSGVEDDFEVKTCSFNDVGVAVRESGNDVTVSSVLYETDCVTRINDIDDLNILSVTVYSMCPNVEPHIEWYTYIGDFISGTGIFNETLLFHGVYPNVTLGQFSFNLAFIFMIGLIYLVSVILLVYKMGQAFNESYVEFRTQRKVNFCNKLFTSWDFNITNPDTSDLSKTHIKTDFQEELADINAKEHKRTPKELALVVFIRIWTNVFVLISLIGAAVAIYYSTEYELSLANRDSNGVSIIAEYLSAIVISLLNAVYPFMFTLVARLEKYKTASGEVTMTLLRTILVRLSSLLVLLSSLYTVVSRCTFIVEPEDGMETECTFSSVTGNLISNITDSTDDCPVCWETFIGQQFFRLALTNLFVSIGSTILVETGRNFASYVVKKIKHKTLGTLLKKVVKKGNFNIPKSILDLIYTQSLLWLGFLFSPLLPTIVLLTSFCLFYVKKYSLLFNLEPDKKGFARSAKTNFLFLFLMLLSLFAAAIPVLYAATQLKPSDNCGPFRGQDTMYQSISFLIEDFSCPVQIAVDFFSSAAFVVPFLIFLLLLLYAMYILLKARDARFQLIKKQLFLEGANVTHIVGHLDVVLSKLSKERGRTESADGSRRISAHDSKYMEDLVKRYSNVKDMPHSIGTLDTTVL